MVIVDSADELNINAANALLKSLEEPPARALFVLISAEPSGLLATIRSRCRRLDLSPLSAEDLKAAAGAALSAADLDMPEPEAWRQIERLADGSVRRALQLASTRAGSTSTSASRRSLPRCPRWTGAPPTPCPTRWASAPRSSASRPSSSSSWIGWHGSYAPPRPVAARRTIWRWRGASIKADRLPDWAALWQTVLAERNDALELNLDRKALILGALTRLEALARS